MNTIVSSQTNSMKVLDHRIVKYNENKITKFWIITKDNYGKYGCIIHPFMMSVSNNGMTGQFISSTWYNQRVKVHDPYSIYIVESDYRMSYEKVESQFLTNMDNNNENNGFYSVYKFTFYPGKMQETMNSIMLSNNHYRAPNHDMNVKSECGSAHIKMMVKALVDDNNLVKQDNEMKPHVDKNFMLFTTPTIEIYHS